MMRKIFAVFFLFTLPALANLQWQTTHGRLSRGTVHLDRNVIIATVHPYYLDIEEEAVISTEGSLTLGGDPQSLEIFGRFSLSPGSAIIGMLLWNGDIILKAKLKSRLEADAQYEEVVDRNITPPPRLRDPAIIEWVGKNTYNIKIYPVEMGKWRKIRIRYLIPCAPDPDGVHLPLRSIFSPNIRNKMDFLEYRFKGDASPFSLKMGTGQFIRDISLPSSHLIDPGHEISLFFREGPAAVSVNTHFTTGPYQGYYMNVYSAVPDEILGIVGGDGSYSLVARLRDKNHSYDVNLKCNGAHPYCQSLSFHGKSDAPWENTLSWRLYHPGTGELIKELPQVPIPLQLPKDTAAAILWASSGFPLSKQHEKLLGGRYGFVDNSSSLLALEEDSLGIQAQRDWEAEGVPKLEEKENLVYDPAERPALEVPLIGNEVATSTIPQAVIDKLQLNILKRGSLYLQLHLPQELHAPEKLEVAIFNLQGVKIKSWTLQDLQKALFELENLSLKSGLYLVTLRGRNFHLTRRIALG